MKPAVLRILGILLFVSVCHPAVTTRSEGGRMSITISLGGEPPPAVAAHR